MPPKKPTKDDVARLVKGKPSLNKVGSRKVSHRLRQHELEKLKLAENRGYLLVDAKTREALKNAWHLLCEAKNIDYVVRDRKA